MTSDLSLSESAGSRSLHRFVYAQHGRELMGCKSPGGEPWFIHNGMKQQRLVDPTKELFRRNPQNPIAVHPALA